MQFENNDDGDYIDIGFDFPFYGELKTQPVGAATSYQALGSALVDATLMLQYNLQAGDSIKIGEITLPIAGELNGIPGNNAVSSSSITLSSSEDRS